MGMKVLTKMSMVRSTGGGMIGVVSIIGVVSMGWRHQWLGMRPVRIMKGGSGFRHRGGCRGAGTTVSVGGLRDNGATRKSCVVGIGGGHGESMKERSEAIDIGITQTLAGC